MILPDFQIRELLVDGVAFVPASREDFEPIEDSQIQPASLDVRLAGDFVDHETGRALNWGGSTFFLDPGECVLGSLVERVAIPADLVGQVEGKSSWARRFLTVHSAGFIDPGFRGDITLELKNDGRLPLALRPGDVIAQISFHRLAAPAQRPYGDSGLRSHYQGQTGTTAARG